MTIPFVCFLAGWLTVAATAAVATPPSTNHPERLGPPAPASPTAPVTRTLAIHWRLSDNARALQLEQAATLYQERRDQNQRPTEPPGWYVCRLEQTPQPTARLQPRSALRPAQPTRLELIPARSFTGQSWLIEAVPVGTWQLSLWYEHEDNLPLAGTRQPIWLDADTATDYSLTLEPIGQAMVGFDCRELLPLNDEVIEVSATLVDKNGQPTLTENRSLTISGSTVCVFDLVPIGIWRVRVTLTCRLGSFTQEQLIPVLPGDFTLFIYRFTPRDSSPLNQTARPTPAPGPRRAFFYQLSQYNVYLS